MKMFVELFYVFLIYSNYVIAGEEKIKSCDNFFENRSDKTSYHISINAEEAQRFAKAKALEDSAENYKTLDDCVSQLGTYYIAGVKYENKSNNTQATNQSEKKKLLEEYKTHLDKLSKEVEGLECDKTESCFKLALKLGGFEGKQMFKKACLLGHKQACQIAIFLFKEFGPQHVIDDLKKII